jgi:hypothetical protein
MTVKHSTRKKNSVARVFNTKEPRIFISKVNDIDLFQLNEYILNYFENEYNSLENLKKDLKISTWISKNGELSEQYKGLTKCKELTERIFLIESGKKEAEYIFKTENILKEYDVLLKNPIKIDFSSGKETTDETRKNKLFYDFINIAREYVTIDMNITKESSIICIECKKDMVQSDDLLFVCECCGYSERMLTTVTNYQDNTRINSNQRYVYERRANFLNIIKEFQGIQNTKISEGVRKDLHEQIKNHDLTKDRITKDHIYEFLKISGHSDAYKDRNLLYTEISGKSSPDISHLVPMLLIMFDIALPVFERIKSPDRLNFLHGQFVLFKFLELLGWNCNEDDFYILKTREKIIEHDQRWKIICEELDWVYIPTV